MHKKGFTILELVVVLALIGVLFAIVSASFADTKAKSRDATRMQNLQDIQNALNIYYTNRNAFPVVSEETTITSDDVFSQALEAEGVISETPTDPQHPTRVYTYQSSTGGADYTITFCLETNTVKGHTADCNNTKGP